MQPTLVLGSTGDAVRRLKRLLTDKLADSPHLSGNDIFDRQTRSAVMRYQTQEWLVVDGVVGPCTWNALMGLEQFKEEVQTNLVPQPTDMTCWAASTAMLLGLPNPVPGVEGIADDTGIWNDSARTDQYARAYNLTKVSGQSWMPAALASMMRDHGRLMMDVLWNEEDYISGNVSTGSSPSHFVVMAGIRGTSRPTETTVRIYDPLPVRTGSIYSRNYARLMRSLPAFTYEIYYAPLALFGWGRSG
jgi:peptidoglycan hydrolase-like protein with peptidoglycan-binding domain